jgi:hypothetical protein
VAKAEAVHHKEVALPVLLVKAEKVKEKVEDKRVKKKDAKILKIYQHHN